MCAEAITFRSKSHTSLITERRLRPKIEQAPPMPAAPTDETPTPVGTVAATN